jgi:YVTN family beta-propeller protein
MVNRNRLYFIALISVAIISIIVSIAGAAPFAYITNEGNKNVSVIDTATNTVTATVNVGTGPGGVAVTPDGTKVYVANFYSNNVSVIDTATNTVTATIDGFSNPTGVAVTPDGRKVYVTNPGESSYSPPPYLSGNVSVIDAKTNTIITTVNVGLLPGGVAITPDGTKVYVANLLSNNVSIIDTGTNTVISTVNVGLLPGGVAVTPDGRKVYVTNLFNNNVSVINTKTNKVIATVPVGKLPLGIAVIPDGSKAYVANNYTNNVSVINTATNNVIASVDVGINPTGITANPEGTTVYVANRNSNTVSVINTVTDNVIATVPVGTKPVSFGQFIGKEIPIKQGYAALTIVKSADPRTYDSVGQIIKYTYTVTNNGNLDISAPITVTDDKLGTISIQNSGILNPGSSVTGTATYKITDADVNTDSKTNLAYAIGSFNNKPIISPVVIVVVPYEHSKHPPDNPSNAEDNNGESYICGPYSSGYGGTVVPVPIYSPMYGSTMHSSPMYGNEPSTTAVLNSESNVYKDKIFSSKCHKGKCALTKHKHKNRLKHHNT